MPQDHLFKTPFVPPRPAPYFATEPAWWAKAETKIGIAWRTESRDPRRSVPTHLAASLVEDVPYDVEVLQSALTAHDVEHFPTARPRSLAVIADVIHGLDLVITVDGLVARIATALHRPTWVLKAAGAEWRSTCPDWASANCEGFRIYEQSHPGDWSDMIRRVADDLSFCCQGGTFVLS